VHHYSQQWGDYDVVTVRMFVSRMTKNCGYIFLVDKVVEKLQLWSLSIYSSVYTLSAAFYINQWTLSHPVITAFHLYMSKPYLLLMRSLVYILSQNLCTTCPNHFYQRVPTCNKNAHRPSKVV